ncbi:MAG: hypothetical protein ITG00_11255 [Flavobacterium sp.]|nr:hypothetical protein [Flavobacterium sp.]
MPELHEYELIISQGKRPLWKSAVAAVLFTMVLYKCYELSLVILQHGLVNEVRRSIVNGLAGIGYCLAAGIYLTRLVTILVDVDTNRLITRSQFGPFSFDRQKIAPDFEYIAIYIDANGEYQSSLWYKGNRHMKLFGFGNDADAALKFAQHVSDRLNIDILDKRVKGESKWIDYQPATSQNQMNLT